MVVGELIKAGASVNQVCAHHSLPRCMCIVIVCLILLLGPLASGEREGLLCPPLCFLLTPGGAVPGAAVGPWGSHQLAGNVNMQLKKLKLEIHPRESICFPKKEVCA